MTPEKEMDCLIVTTEEVNRLLEVGHLLLSVLTHEELAQLQQLVNGYVVDNQITTLVPFRLASAIGNTGVT